MVKKMAISYLAYTLVFVILCPQLTPGRSVAYRCQFNPSSAECRGRRCRLNPSSAECTPRTKRPITTTKTQPVIESIRYHTEDKVIRKSKDVNLATSTAKNCCPEERRKNNRCSDVSAGEVWLDKTVTETLSWDRTSGRSVSSGTTFTAGTPSLSTSFALIIERSTSHTWGRTESQERKFSNRIPGAKAEPGQKKVCEYFTTLYNVDVPFTITWNDGEKTKGVFKGRLSSHNEVDCRPTWPDSLNPPGKSGC